MLIYLQKCYHIFDNVDFLFNRHYIDDLEALFSTSAIFYFVRTNKLFLKNKKIILVNLRKIKKKQFFNLGLDFIIFLY